MKRLNRIMAAVVAMVVGITIVFGTGVTAKAEPTENMVNGRVKVTFDKKAFANFLSEHTDYKWYYYDDDFVTEFRAMLVNNAEATAEDFAKIITVEGLKAPTKISARFEYSKVQDNKYVPYTYVYPNDHGISDDMVYFLEIEISKASNAYYFDDPADNNYVDAVGFTMKPETCHRMLGRLVIYIELGTMEEILDWKNLEDPKPDPEPMPCEHVWAWVTEGEKESLRCKKCGELAIDAMNHLHAENLEKIDVEMVWNSLPARIMEALAAAGKETTFHYFYKGYEVTITVPAGKVFTVEGVEWYGPEYLADLFKEYTSVKNWRGPVSMEVLFK